MAGYGNRPGRSTGGTVQAATEQQRPRMADSLREGLRALAQSDARFYRELDQLAPGAGRVPVRGQGRAALPAAQQQGSSRRISDSLREGMRALAQSDARLYREIAELTKGGRGSISGGRAPRQLKGRKSS